MKKKSKPLSLRRTTLRNLDARKLERAAGGTLVGITGWLCWVGPISVQPPQTDPSQLYFCDSIQVCE